MQENFAINVVFVLPFLLNVAVDFGILYISKDKCKNFTDSFSHKKILKKILNFVHQDSNLFSFREPSVRIQIEYLWNRPMNKRLYSTKSKIHKILVRFFISLMLLLGDFCIWNVAPFVKFLLKGTVNLISNDPPGKDDNAHNGTFQSWSSIN